VGGSTAGGVWCGSLSAITPTIGVAYDTLNARISLSGEQWDVTLWGKNITDEEYLEEVIQAPEFGGSFIHPGARDAYGVDFSYRF
jgi:iron complex outermembrane receptor protein